MYCVYVFGKYWLIIYGKEEGKMLVHRFEAVKDLCPSIPAALPVDLAFDAPLVVAVELSPAEDTSEGIGRSVHHRI